MKCIVIGLGIYGSNLARDLTDSGNEVIAVDKREDAVDNVKDYVTTVYRLDSTDEHQLGVLPVTSVDLIIVAIGENFGASIRTVAILKQLGAKRLYARAIDPLHHSIMECFDIDRILIPEQRAASDLTMELAFGSRVETLALSDTTAIVKFSAPDFLVGMPYDDLRPLTDASISLVAATRKRESRNLLRLKTRYAEPLDTSEEGATVEAGDELTCLGTRTAFRRLMRLRNAT